MYSPVALSHHPMPLVGFSIPQKLYHLDNVVESIALFWLDFIVNSYNTIMGAENCDCINGAAIVILDILLVPVALIAVAETAVRLALAILLSPLYLCSDLPAYIAYSAAISLAQFPDTFYTMAATLTSKTNVGRGPILGHVYNSLFPGVAPTVTSAITDTGRIYRAHVREYVEPTTVEGLQAIIKRGGSISFAGQRHSQGGHTFTEGGVTVDMRSLNRILAIDPIQKVVRVQTGATWEDIQNAINPYRLSVKVMQSSNIFTVGGSLSVNVHGRDPRFGALIETIRSITLIQPDGNLVTLQRGDELFQYAIGGYGLFGAIVEAEIELTDDVIYSKHAETMRIEDYPAYFKREVLGHPNIGLHFARLNIARDNLMHELIAVSYREIRDDSHDRTLQPESGVLTNKCMLHLLRNFDCIKNRRWPLEVSSEMRPETISRNQAMRPSVKCLTYESATESDILQEYFVPVDQFASFVHAFRTIVDEEGINLMNVTIRYVPKDTQSKLPYAKTDCFAFVIYVTQGLSPQETERAKAWTQRLTTAALNYNGTYYLPYQLYPTREQLHRAYPEVGAVFQKKRRLDPSEKFTNLFYQTYSSSQT